MVFIYLYHGDQYSDLWLTPEEFHGSSTAGGGGEELQYPLIP